MDLLREKGCFRSLLRVCANPVRDIWVRWFTLPENTPYLPFPTVFGSGIWQWSKGVYEGDSCGWILGAPKVWDKGLPPPIPDPYAAGDPSWWVYGIPASQLP